VWETTDNSRVMLVADGRIALFGSRLVDWERGETTARPIAFPATAACGWFL
jgi:hypothetical protein